MQVSLSPLLFPSIPLHSNKCCLISCWHFVLAEIHRHLHIHIVNRHTSIYIHIRKLTITNSQWRIQKVEGASITLSSIILLLWLHFCRRLCARHYALLFSSAVLVANLINMRAFIQINQRQSNRLRGVGRLTPQFPHSFIFPSPSPSLSFLFAYRMCFMRLCILWYINLSWYLVWDICIDRYTQTYTSTSTHIHTCIYYRMCLWRFH